MAYRASKKDEWTWVGIKDNVNIIEVSGSDSFIINDVEITTVDVKHTIATQAYRFDIGGQSIVVSGDLLYSETIIELAKDADILIMDSGAIIKNDSKGNASVKNEDRAHATLEEVATMANDANVSKLILTHIGGDIDEEAEIEAINKIFSGEVIIAYDSLVVEP